MGLHYPGKCESDPRNQSSDILFTSPVTEQKIYKRHVIKHVNYCKCCQLVSVLRVRIKIHYYFVNTSDNTHLRHNIIQGEVLNGRKLEIF